MRGWDVSTAGADDAAYGNGTLPAGVRSRIIENINGLSMHVLEAGQPGDPCILLLHGFPELAYSWRKIMLPLASADFHIIHPISAAMGARRDGTRTMTGASTRSVS